jgi:hypothetical protein
MVRRGPDVADYITQLARVPHSYGGHGFLNLVISRYGQISEYHEII